MHANFLLLRPQDLPRALSLPAHPAVAHALRPVVELDPGQQEDGILAAVDHALERLPVRPADLPVAVDDAHESVGNRDNDVAFAITRISSGDPLLVLVHSALRGYQVILRESLTSGTDLSPVEWTRLHHGFEAMFRLYAGLGQRREARPDRPPPGPNVVTGDALRRWESGHCAFMVLLQGLIMAIRGFADAVAEGSVDRADEQLGIATAIMTASGSTLRFTGDFPYTEYERTVRPTLLPPIAPPRMSGLYWRDHEYFVAELTRLRTLFAGLDDRLVPARRAFAAAMKATYDAHQLVCASFVGPEQPSVLMSARSHLPAVVALERFMQARVSLVDTQAERATGPTPDK